MPLLQRLFGRAGTGPSLRPIRPGDAPALGALIDGLSPHDRVLRFHGAVNGLGSETLRRWAEVDPGREMAVVATVRSEAGDMLVADARYAIDIGGEAAEIGLVVAPAWRRRGLGARCIEALRLAAHRAGVRWLYGTVLAKNLPMLALLKRNGFSVAQTRGQHGVLVLEACVDDSWRYGLRGVQ